MPELPEVEVTRRSVAEPLTGARILACRLGKPLRWPLGTEPDRLVGRVVQAVSRRGKYLLLQLDQGLLLVHLGMSGSLRMGASLPPPGAHDHFEMATDRGTLRLTDPRRFGAVVFAPARDDPAAVQLLGRLGAEPLEHDFDLPSFAAALKRRSAPIKQVLLAGDVVVGVGNIYASEALFRAGIRPTTRAARIGPARVARLHAAIRQVLAQAVAAGGSTLRDFADAHGEAGLFQASALVYGRAGEPCRLCAAPVRMFRQGQRSTFWCPSCQT